MFRIVKLVIFTEKFNFSRIFSQNILEIKKKAVYLHR